MKNAWAMNALTTTAMTAATTTSATISSAARQREEPPLSAPAPSTSASMSLVEVIGDGSAPMVEPKAGSEVPLLLDLGPLPDAIAQVVQLGSTHVAADHDLDLGHGR